jgi:ankyrin repeat protein
VPLLKARLTLSASYSNTVEIHFWPIKAATMLSGSVSSILCRIMLDDGLISIVSHVQVACGYNHTEVLKELIAWVKSKNDKSLLEAFIKSPNEKGDGPLLASAFKGHTDILRLIKSSLSNDDFARLVRNSDNKNGDDAVSVSVSTQNVEYLRALFVFLVEAGHNARDMLRKRNSRGLMPLHVAAERGSVDIFKELVSHVHVEEAYFLLTTFDDPLVHGSPSDTSVRGTNVLHTACLCGHHSIVAAILDLLNDDRHKHFLTNERKQRFLNKRNSKGQTGHWIAARGKGYPDRERCRIQLELVNANGLNLVDCDIRDDDDISGKEAGEKAVETRKHNEKMKEASRST